jgi:glycosyltransferase involved in cell wall biosynthesis
VPLHRLTASSALGRARELRRLIRAERPDVVHASLVGSSIVTRLAAARTGRPVLTSLVNTTYTAPAPLSQPGVRRFVVRSLDGWTARHLNAAFHAISRAAAADAVEHLHIDPQLVTVIPRGRTLERLGRPSAARRTAARLALGFDPDAEVVVCVGRQERQKDQATLVAAWALIADARPSAELVIAGRPGRASPAIDAALAALPPAAAARVHRPGHVDAVGDLLAAADVFAFPSLHEGLGGAVVEALALGLPIVATDLDVFREFLTDGVNARLVPPADPDALGHAIVEVLADPQQRAAMAAANLAVFDETFSMDRVLDETAALYRRVAADAD